MVSHYSVFSDGLWTVLTEPCPRRNLTTVNGLNTVRNLNLLNRALSRANGELYSNNYNIQHQSATHQLTGNSTSSSSSCSSTGSTNLSNRLNHSTKAKIKDWLISMNQRWSQLLVSMQCRPNGAHQLIHDCDSIKYGVVGYSKAQDSMQINTAFYNYQLYNAAVMAATHAVQQAKQQMMNNKCTGLNSLECGHNLCESLYGQSTKTGNLVNLSNLNSTNTTTTTNDINNKLNNEQETPSLFNSCPFNSSFNTFSLPQNSINDGTTNFRSMLDLNAPLIYLDYNKGN